MDKAKTSSESDNESPEKSPTEKDGNNCDDKNQQKSDKDSREAQKEDEESGDGKDEATKSENDSVQENGATRSAENLTENGAEENANANDSEGQNSAESKKATTDAEDPPVEGETDENGSSTKDAEDKTNTAVKSESPDETSNTNKQDSEKTDEKKSSADTTTVTANTALSSESAKPKSAEDKQFEENVKFLYRSHQREPGKRRVKPNLQLLEMDLNIPEEDSEDDSDYKVEGDEDVDNSDPGSEADHDEDETAEENSTDTDNSSSSGEDSDANTNAESGAAAAFESGKRKGKKGKKREKDGKENRTAKENGQSPTALDKAKQIAEKALELNGIAEAAIKILVCNICLGDRSAESDEIVECDNCGVTVHEGCYGVSDSDSVLSTGSSASTEPWFCDSCKAGVLSPNCELCPNTGGIFKETDAGRWVHLVCALYTPGCAFGSVEKLTPVTLFEMQYSKWGQRACHLCEDAMMARTGVTISCDAGMCRISFHVTCAQRMGLLSDANPEYIADPFYAHCKVHVDKSKMKSKKKNWSILQHQQRLRKEKDMRDEAEGQELSKEKERVLRKLTWLRDRYASNKASKPKPWLPTQKMPRLLHSSSTAIEKFRRKADLYGLSHLLIAPPEDKRWHGQPAFSADFVAYFLDRQRRFTELEQSLEKNIDENTALRKQQALMNQLYEKVAAACKKEREDGRYLTAKLNALWSPLKDIGGLRYDPRILEEKKTQREKENGTSGVGGGGDPLQKQQGSGSVSPQKIIKSCKVCGSSEEPHQQLECEQCRSWFHLFCLQPPLTRFPKKSKGVNWLCEDCLEANRVQAESANALVLSSSRRSRGQSSRLAREASLDAGEETGSRPARGRPAGKKRGRKPGSKNKDKSAKEKDAAQLAAAASSPATTTTPVKDKESRGKEKEPTTSSDKESPSTKPASNETSKQEKESNKDKEAPTASARESDAETEDDVAMAGMDEEEDEPSPEKKQPSRGRKKRKGPVPKGGPGGKRKRTSATKEKETSAKDEDENDADVEMQDEAVAGDDTKAAEDNPTTTAGATAKTEASSSKRESGGGTRDKQQPSTDTAEEHHSKKKEEKKSASSKDTEPKVVNDDKTGNSDEHEKDDKASSKDSSANSSGGGKISSNKGSSGNTKEKESKDSKDSNNKDAESAKTGSAATGATSRKERDSSSSTAGDGRKHCVKCENVENTNQIVICDECGSGVHWACLDPPSKKNPKPRGYTWNCEDCDNRLEATEANNSNNINHTNSKHEGKEKAKTGANKQQENETPASASTEAK